MKKIWAKVVVDLPKDVRIRRAGLMAELFFIRLLLVSRELLSDGFIDETQIGLASVGFTGSTRKLADKLVEVGVMERTPEGWRIKNWAKYQTLKEDVEANSKKRSESGKKGASARWQDGKPDGNLPSESHGSAIDNALTLSMHRDRDRVGEDKSSPVAGVPTTIKGKRNEPLDALVAVDGTDPLKATSPAFSAAGKALQAIREVTPAVTAAEIRRRAENYRLHMKDAILSPFALAKHWALCDTQPAPNTRRPTPPTPEQAAAERQRIAAIRDRELAVARGEIPQ